MFPTWASLAVLALALAWPVPILLANAAWPARAPATALIVWQSIALTGGLSMIGALLSYGLEPFGYTLVDGLRALPGALLGGGLPPGTTFAQMFALSGAILLGIHLLLNLVTTFVRAQRSRLRHRRLVTLLSSPMPERPDTRLIDHEAPVAYCLPGTTRSMTVLSAGLMALLDEQQLGAVIAHEQAHATQRHHLVLLAFRAWRGSLPWFPIATRAHEAVAILVEMLADDQARRVVPDDVLVTSIALVASESGLEVPSGRSSALLEAEPHSALAADSPSAARRIARLVGTRAPLGAAAQVTAIGLAVALVAVPTALLLAPALG
jgi:Zn-dependent protease with chaperone function